MKIKLFSVFLVLLLLAGCGSEQSIVSSEAPASEPQVFGQAPSAAVETAETTAMPALPEETPDAVSSAPEGAPLAPEEADDGEAEWSPLHAQLTALILMQESDGLSYQPEDPVAVLRALGYLVNLMQAEDGSISVSGSAGTISDALAEDYVKALFGDFSGQFPAVTEEDPLVKRSGSNYEINLVELGDLVLTCGPQVEALDGTCTVSASLEMDGRPSREYTFTLKKAAHGPFSLAVTAME